MLKSEELRKVYPYVALGEESFGLLETFLKKNEELKKQDGFRLGLVYTSTGIGTHIQAEIRVNGDLLAHQDITDYGSW